MRAGTIITLILGILAAGYGVWYFFFRKKNGGNKPSPPYPPTPPTPSCTVWPSSLLTRKSNESNKDWSIRLWQQAAGLQDPPPFQEYGGTGNIANQLGIMNSLTPGIANEVCQGTCYWNPSTTAKAGMCRCTSPIDNVLPVCPRMKLLSSEETFL